ncbi:hypothetical protein BX600DRAFT_308887 [Xylariales sp. PMI_506]|nr:hypothetical protein BX600DRAFT_308887 [Xylariales sp. PMI_506]
MADVTTLEVTQPKRMPSSQSLVEEQEFSTNPDPRSRALSPATGSPTPTHHPDLNDEVATLSTKLINAINHQTTLDDTLGSTRHELELAKDKVRELEEKLSRQQEYISGSMWVKRATVESEKAKLLLRVAEEKRQRTEVEKDKKKIEQELENLTAALFEEANKMVISAKEEAQKEHDALQRKNDLLKAQLADTEGLLKSQQEQLAELKLVMEQMTIERDDHSGTTPSSPGFSKFDPRDDDTHASDSTSQSAITEPFSPTYPTNLSHLVQPVLRTDLGAYDDFLALIQTSKRVSNRASSGSYNGLNPLLNLGSTPANASATSLPQTGATGAHGASQAASSAASATAGGPAAIPLPPLKETKFYKRALAEDIEPTLRLDIAPGLSWLARRSVLSAMTEGSLVVEPVPTNSPFASISKPQFYPCSLCGETRKDATHLRMHRFRTSEIESAQRYPLCKYCLSRVRSTCDFLGFLRIVKDGHWRADDADAERAAWEESVRLREQMFWSRIGGGVVPTMQSHHQLGSLGEKSPRPSQEALRPPFATEIAATSEVPSEGTVACTDSVEPVEDSKSADTVQPAEPSTFQASVEDDAKVAGAEVDSQSLAVASDYDSKLVEKGVQKLSITIPTA